MSELIAWTVAAGSLVFTLGLISAIGSRWQRQRQMNSKSKQARPHAVQDGAFEMQLQTYISSRTEAYLSSKSKKTASSPMSMAANGVGNVVSGEENLASVGNHSS